jgi:hypothetical protein
MELYEMGSQKEVLLDRAILTPRAHREIRPHFGAATI